LSFELSVPTLRGLGDSGLAPVTLVSLSVLLFKAFAFRTNHIILYMIYSMAESSETDKMLRGELFRAFTPDLVAARARCKYACNRFNKTDEVPRRRLVELWRE
jgi:hypothetical protein